jgi:hypothetical protein
MEMLTTSQKYCKIAGAHEPVAVKLLMCLSICSYAQTYV